MMDKRKAKTECPAEGGPPFNWEHPVHKIIMILYTAKTVQQKIIDKFHWTKLLPSKRHPCIAGIEIFHEINLLPCTHTVNLRLP